MACNCGKRRLNNGTSVQAAATTAASPKDNTTSTDTGSTDKNAKSSHQGEANGGRR